MPTFGANVCSEKSEKRFLGKKRRLRFCPKIWEKIKRRKKGATLHPFFVVQIFGAIADRLFRTFSKGRGVEGQSHRKLQKINVVLRSVFSAKTCYSKKNICLIEKKFSVKIRVWLI